MLAVKLARFYGLNFSARANMPDIVNAVCATADNSEGQQGRGIRIVTAVVTGFFAGLSRAVAEAVRHHLTIGRSPSPPGRGLALQPPRSPPGPTRAQRAAGVHAHDFRHRHPRPRSLRRV
jgi:hypothetical protein